MVSDSVFRSVEFPFRSFTAEEEGARALGGDAALIGGSLAEGRKEGRGGRRLRERLNYPHSSSLLGTLPSPFFVLHAYNQRWLDVFSRLLNVFPPLPSLPESLGPLGVCTDISSSRRGSCVIPIKSRSKLSGGHVAAVASTTPNLFYMQPL